VAGAARHGVVGLARDRGRPGFFAVFMAWASLHLASAINLVVGIASQ
jgi:hypothetical protein